MAKILVVDDEPDYREELRLSLSEEGHEVKTANDASDAIEISQRFRADVLVTDWMLKNSIDGLDLGKRLRANIPALVIVVITGYPTAALKAATQRSDNLVVLEKPFETSDLLDVVQNAAKPGDG